jgi:hypothetical protein
MRQNEGRHARQNERTPGAKNEGAPGTNMILPTKNYRVRIDYCLGCTVGREYFVHVLNFKKTLAKKCTAFDL